MLKSLLAHTRGLICFNIFLVVFQLCRCSSVLYPLWYLLLNLMRSVGSLVLITGAVSILNVLVHCPVDAAITAM